MITILIICNAADTGALYAGAKEVDHVMVEWRYRIKRDIETNQREQIGTIHKVYVTKDGTSTIIPQLAGRHWIPEDNWKIIVPQHVKDWLEKMVKDATNDDVCIEWKYHGIEYVPSVNYPRVP